MELRSLHLGLIISFLQAEAVVVLITSIILYILYVILAIINQSQPRCIHLFDSWINMLPCIIISLQLLATQIDQTDRAGDYKKEKWKQYRQQTNQGNRILEWTLTFPFPFRAPVSAPSCAHCYIHDTHLSFASNLTPHIMHVFNTT